MSRMSQKAPPSGANRRQLTLDAALGSTSVAPSPSTSTSSSLSSLSYDQTEVEARARSLMEHRDQLGCAGCGRLNTLTFSSDKAGRLRVQCQGKAPACHRSWAVRNFVKWATAILPSNLVATQISPSPSHSVDLLAGGDPPSPVISQSRPSTPSAQPAPSLSQHRSKRALSHSPADTIPPKRILAQPSPLMDPREMEIRLLRESNDLLKEQLLALQSTLSVMQV